MEKKQEVRLFNRPTEQQYREMGLGRHLVDRSTHPQFYVSSWPVVNGTETLDGRERYRLPNLNFNSVLITVLSNHWCEGGWHRLQDMISYTESKGYKIALEELDDMSMMPTDAIGQMRAGAALLALDSGFEWSLMLDTDVLVEKDTLVRLLQHDRPVIYPYLHIPNDAAPGAPLSSPMMMRSHQGLQPVIWSAMSVMLFNTKVFNCLDPYSWHGHDYHFAQNLAHYGHRIYMDTDTVVEVVRGPSRHPSKTWEEYWEGAKRGWASRANDDRNRRPPPGFDGAFSKEGYVDEYGTYWGRESWKHSSVRGPTTEITPKEEKNV